MPSPAALEQRPRARRAVDHHRAAREQAERRREQDRCSSGCWRPLRGGRAAAAHPTPFDGLSRRSCGSAPRAPRSRRTGRSSRTPARAARRRRAARASGRGRRRARGRRRRRRCRSPRAMRSASSPMRWTLRARRPTGRAQRREVLTLPTAAEDEVHAGRERAQRDERRLDVRRLGVVDVEHAVVRRDLLEAVRDAGERRAGPATRIRRRATARPPRRPSRSARCAARAGGSRRRRCSRSPCHHSAPSRSRRSAVVRAAEAHPPRRARHARARRAARRPGRGVCRANAWSFASR